ncbi:unnamed protein product [Microthlaspi erraticum]|uniref:Uncharacterized protein n=1 Tax=Microthlaspi erraticum TaxID=1685480 RepID=A0A6D2JVT6_9BRAS|nr:unnamed protein product [Microthlaspi erraticum]CAA7044376.1 unnamed protein product [Microthlaspi erraticum]
MAAADGIFRCIFEGCISGLDSAIERRPYHKNCGCALHDGSRGAGKTKNQRRTSCRRHGSSESISFPIRRSWSEGNIMAMNFPSSSSSSNLQSLSSSSNLQSLSSSSSLTNLTSPADLPVDGAASEDRSRSHNHQLGWTIDEGEDLY